MRQKEPDFLKQTLTKFRTLLTDEKTDLDTQKLRKMQRKKFQARAASVNRQIQQEKLKFLREIKISRQLMIQENPKERPPPFKKQALNLNLGLDHYARY